MTEDNSLQRSGVKGMRWGVRKSGGSSSVKPSTDRKTVDKLREKPVHALTNKQLKTVNGRLQLEKSFKDLKKQPNAIDKINKGHNAAKAIIAVGATAITVYNMSQTPAGKATINAGKRAWNIYVNGAIPMGT